MNFRKTMFLILCMLTVRCHAGNFIPLYLGKIMFQFFNPHILRIDLLKGPNWISNNYHKLRSNELSLLKKRLENEERCHGLIVLSLNYFDNSSFDAIYEVLIAYLDRFPLVIVNGNDPNAAMKFMNHVDKRYNGRFPQACFDQESNFMFVYIEKSRVTFFFYGSSSVSMSFFH